MPQCRHGSSLLPPANNGSSEPSRVNGGGPTVVRAAVILPWDRADERGEPAARRSAEHKLAEAVGLTASIGLVRTWNRPGTFDSAAMPCSMALNGRSRSEVRTPRPRNSKRAMSHAAASPKTRLIGTTRAATVRVSFTAASAAGSVIACA